MANRTRKRTTLVETVVEQIRALIDRQQFAAGSPLPSTAELGEQFHVSRTVLREAISRLASMGLLTVEHGRGVFVGNRDAISKCTQLVRSAMSISRRDLVQLTEFRRGIECQAARLAAQRATDGDVAELEAICERMDQAGQDDEEAVRCDLEFHKKLAAMSGNELTRNVMEVIQQFVLAGMMRTTPQPRCRPLSQDLHRGIVAAIRNRDPEAAEKAMLAHMDDLAYRVREVVEDQ
jgi:GntR family transcriptional repressor for pyruvate dehydrogenase complex